ncbi:MAG: sigma-70 family RNA polymerase sigma factor [Verrucomicrobiae bacterium]|nr:sigma-70 family RNA polymerase sigma factor [Verrucomicrobiae bacterium]
MKSSESASNPAEFTFGTTHWSVVLAAGQGDSPLAEVALDRLCRAYWYPVFGFIRHHGHPAEEARDLTQEFFARLLIRGGIGKADPSRGRFRAFLLTSIRNFLSDAWDWQRAKKRGGGLRTISLEELGCWEDWMVDSDATASPEQVFDQAWAGSVLRNTCSHLRDEYAAAGRTDRFEALEPYLPGGNAEEAGRGLGQRLGLTEAALRSEVHRLRRRFRALLRREVAHTVATPEEIDGEIRYLMQVVAG